MRVIVGDILSIAVFVAVRTASTFLSCLNIPTLADEDLARNKQDMYLHISTKIKKGGVPCVHDVSVAPTYSAPFVCPPW
jgi:hypothetical protein